ncbi:DUF2971 domain-containing protein [Aeromonas hydrophila]|uniref:DUF2971 domain-containing protein n=1 Tax=Aeromonas hydrophila TaxID=644 RepID=UPI001A30D4AA|nr:DUF2971 domain-containing protein [Aeromonas hydrophila]MCP3243397.1 DUF2971 domain-containing protein [Aeromonas hydrophila]HAU4896449.1 DUF2971 domain-containing protein [Aeromonas hydrophila]
MEILYKYTKFFDLETISSGTIRLSPPETLNDPFEHEINSEVEEELINTALAFDLEIFKDSSFTPELIRTIKLNFINGDLSSYGIVSLSETPRNLLMWAHYADEHKGVCIGYKKNLFIDLENKKETELAIEQYYPIKVNYDSIRPQKLKKGAAKNEILKKQITSQLLTKSNDWIYEKEHRCIIPMLWADEIKLLNGIQERLTDNRNKILFNLKLHKQIAENNKGNLYDCGNKISGISTLVKIFGNNKDVMFIKNINPSSIASIHLGCRFSEDKANEIISEISSPKHPLNHVEIYKYQIDKKRFELKEKQIHPKVL